MAFADSPLSMVMQSARVQRLIEQLQRVRQRVQSHPERTHALHFSLAELRCTREDFDRAMRRGQSKLHRLCGLIAQTYFCGPYEVRSQLVGEVVETRERFLLGETIDPQTLYAVTDSELARRKIDRLGFRLEGRSVFARARLIANLVEYSPEEDRGTGILKLTSRIKGEQEVWNKVVDEIFELDQLVARDKKLCELSRFVKDIFGLKFIVTDGPAADSLLLRLSEREWSEEELKDAQVPWQLTTHSLQWLETKNYQTGHCKRSGWKALKSVVQWWDSTFEIQVQSMHSYFRELQRLNQDSHESFRQRRTQLRSRVAEQIPLFAFYTDLLRWLMGPQPRRGAPPTFPGIVLELSE
ncbi:MAG: hypothetical protein J0I12_29170 [Candidatus Eremiobacteraeota bacterium]|nr:hypothetical protein [Candidatus Eremiobacteraeota bacterium]